ncbi:hypothetical protein ACFL2Q_02750 [Thermodesulfobacteriota bacterium]
MTSQSQRHHDARRESSSASSKAKRPNTEESDFFTDADYEMNEDPEGFFSEDSEPDQDEKAGEEFNEDVDDEEHYEESSEGEQEEASDSAEEGPDITPSVKTIVRNINDIAFKHVEHGKLAIGEYVLNVVFNDKIEDVLSKNPNKKESLRQICEDDELRVDRRRLSNWVRAAALKRDLEANEIDCSEIMTSQLVAVLRVKDQEKRRELAAEVVPKKLSVRQILEKANTLNQAASPNNLGKTVRKKIEEPLKLLKDKDTVALLQDEHRLADEINYKDRTEIITVIDEVAKQIEQSKTFLDEVRDNLFLIDMERVRNRKS